MFMQMILGAPDNYVECPLQPEHLQFLLWGGGSPADNEVSGNGRFQISPSTWNRSFTVPASHKSINMLQIHTRHAPLLVQPDDQPQAGENIPGRNCHQNIDILFESFDI